MLFDRFIWPFFCLFCWLLLLLFSCVLVAAVASIDRAEWLKAATEWSRTRAIALSSLSKPSFDYSSDYGLKYGCIISKACSALAITVLSEKVTSCFSNDFLFIWSTVAILYTHIHFKCIQQRQPKPTSEEREREWEREIDGFECAMSSWIGYGLVTREVERLHRVIWPDCFYFAAFFLLFAACRRRCCCCWCFAFSHVYSFYNIIVGRKQFQCAMETKSKKDFYIYISLHTKIDSGTRL